MNAKKNSTSLPTSMRLMHSSGSSPTDSNMTLLTPLASTPSELKVYPA